MANSSKTNGFQSFSITAPAALSVQLVGDFTKWQNKPIALKKCAKGVWRTEVPLGRGTHHYKFIIDGQWHDDPECTLRIPNPFGTENMVCEVKK